MIGRRGFITGLLASAAMPMLIDKHRVVLVGWDFGRSPEMVALGWTERNQYIIVSRMFKSLFDEQLAQMQEVAGINDFQEQ